MRTHILLIALLLVGLVQLPAQATLISVDDEKFGTGSFTFDTATGLEWLDLSQTFGKPMNSIVADSGAGGTYSGLRYATADQLRALYTDAGLYAYPGHTPELFWAEYNLMGLIGYAPQFSGESKYGGSRYVWGITGTHTPPPAGWPDDWYIGSALYAQADYPVGSGFLRTYVDINQNCDDVRFRSTDTWDAQGSFLVRDHSEAAPVPEPGTILLLSMGLAGAAWLRRRVTA